LGALFYKNTIIAKEGVSESVSILEDMKESVALKALWTDKKTTKNVEKFKIGISPSKFKWTRKGKKLTATFTAISANSLNGLMKKLMNTAVEIQKLEINKSGLSYTVELKCKW
jgi:hypothetical protein